MDLTNELTGVKAEESQERKPYIPEGKYNVIIEKITERKNETGWLGLNFQLKVIGKDYNNACLFDLVTVAHKTSTKAVEIGMARMKSISELTGATITEQMLGKKLHIAVGVVPDNYKIGQGDSDAKMNRIWGYGELLAMDNTPVSNTKSDASFSADNIPF